MNSSLRSLPDDQVLARFRELARRWHEHAVDGIRLRCGPHNQWAARQLFGEAFMARFRKDSSEFASAGDDGSEEPRAAASTVSGVSCASRDAASCTPGSRPPESPSVESVAGELDPPPWDVHACSYAC